MSCFCLKNKKGVPEGIKCCFKVFWVLFFSFSQAMLYVMEYGDTLLAVRAPRPPPGVPTEGRRPSARSLTTQQSASIAPAWAEGRFWVRFGCFRAPGAFISVIYSCAFTAAEKSSHSLPPHGIRTQNGADEDTCLPFCGAGWRCGGIIKSTQLLIEDRVLSGTDITALPLLRPMEMPFLGRDPLKAHSGQVCRILA